MDMIKDNENSTLIFKVPRIHLTSSAREEITARRAVWGTDVYTDDSDVVAACIHAGWIRGKWPDDVDVHLLDLQKPASKSKLRTSPAEQHLEVLNSVPASGPIDVPADRDLHVTLLILPTLEKYASSTRYGILSREFGGTYNGRKSVHDGLSFMILSMRWVDGAAPQSRLRGKERRERMHKAWSVMNRMQDVELGEKEVLSKVAVRGQDETKDGQLRRSEGEGNKENHPMGLPASSRWDEASPLLVVGKTSGALDEDEMPEKNALAGAEDGVRKADEQPTSEPSETKQGQTSASAT
jgi:hypothetical protein